jgi:hypothetical protein
MNATIRTGYTQRSAMLLKEIGFEYLLKEIFSISDFTQEAVAQTEHFELSDNELKIKPSAYGKINEYLTNKTNEINETLFILGVMSTFAYSHPDNTLESNTTHYIHAHFNSIIENLESIVPNQEQSFYKRLTGVYSQLVELEFSYDLLESVSHPQNFHRLVQERNNWGISFLLLYIAHVNFEKFDEWFNNTKRVDLKSLFVNFIFDSSHIEKYVSHDFQNSKNALLRTIGIFKDFPISMHFPAVKRDFKIKDIQTTVISDKEKAYVTLYYFTERYRAKELGELDADEELSGDLNSIGQFVYMKMLNAGVLKDFGLQSYNYEITRRVIESLEDNNQKNDLMVNLFHKIKESANDEHIGIHNLKAANILGRTLIALDEKPTKEITRLFDKTYKEIYQPYFHIRHFRAWSTGVLRLMFYLIPLFVKYTNSGEIDLLSVYINKYKDVKHDYHHHMNDDLISILDQITKEIAL